MKYIGIVSSGFIFLLFLVALFSENKNIPSGRKIGNIKSPLHYCGKKEKNFERFVMLLPPILYLISIVVLLLGKYESEHVDYFNKVIEDINGIEGILVAYFGVVISVIIFSVTLGEKEYYLTVTREDIIQHYHIDKVFQTLSICTFFSILCTILLKIYDLKFIQGFYLLLIYQIVYGVIVLLGIYALIFVGLISLGGRRMELYSLNHLYEIFWNNATLKLVNKTSDVIYFNMGYLIKEYTKLNILKHKHFSKIKYLVYKEDIGSDSVWYKLASKIVLVVLVLTWVCSAFVFGTEQNTKGLVLNVVFAVVCIIILRNQRTINIFGKYIINLVLDRNGFLFRFTDCAKFIGTVPLFYNGNARRYILSISNMMALYCIICSCWNNEEKNLVATSLIEMADFIKDGEKCRDKYEKALLYLPVYVCGYYYYVNFGKCGFPEEIIKLYESFGLSKMEKMQYYLTINSFILNSSRCRSFSNDRKILSEREQNQVINTKYTMNSGYWKFINTNPDFS